MLILNKKALHDYQIIEKLEAGIILTGFEVKALRTKNADLTGSAVRLSAKMEAELINAYIPPYQGGNKDYDERRTRKLLLHRRELERVYGKIQQGNITLVPVKLYSKHNLIKLEIGLAKRKKKFEKKEDIKARDIERDVQRELRGEKT